MVAARYKLVVEGKQVSNSSPDDSERTVLQLFKEVFSFFKNNWTYHRISLWSYLEGKADAVENESMITKRMMDIGRDGQDAVVLEDDSLRDEVIKRFLIKNDEHHGWAVVLPDSKAYIAVDYKKCGLVSWFRDQRAPEIAPIACEGDYIQFALWKGLDFKRTKTIADGDDICDMRFYKTEIKT